MKCPFCGYDESKVTDSRTASDMNAIKRRRECLRCANRFTTFETIDLTIQVKKRDGTYEDFSQEKIMKGLDAACRHSKISHDQVLSIVSTITAELMSRQIREITSQELGEIVMYYLQDLDPIAYIRFACVYKRFKNLQDLIGAIQGITPKDLLREKRIKNREESIHGINQE